MTSERINKSVDEFFPRQEIFVRRSCRALAAPGALYNCNLLPGCTLAACSIPVRGTCNLWSSERRPGWGEQLQF